MPGLIGFIGDLADGKPEILLADMAHALRDDEGYQIDLHHGQGFGLGRVSLGISNPEPQPIWNQDNSLAIVMEGELYDYYDLKQWLIARGHHFHVDNDPEFVLHLYQELGADFTTKLNGAFALAIWDQKTNKLILANDRLGLHPLYYAQRKAGLLFASGVRALLADPNLPRQVDLIAIAQLLTFDHVLSERTMMTEAHLLPAASLLTFQDGSITLRTYWTLKYPEVYEMRSEEAYLEELIYLLRQAVARQEPGDLPSGVLLSGGLDSRVILAMLADGPETHPLHTFTFGIPGCDDARFARQAASRVGARHHFFELRPDYLLELAEMGVRINDGLQNCVHMNALATLPSEAKHAKVFYKGFMGDAIMGFFSRRQFLANYDEATVMKILIGHYPIIFQLEEQQRLLTHSFQSMVDGAAFDSCKIALSEPGNILVADQLNHFDVRQRQRRLTLNGVQLVRSQGIVRTPFCDNDLVEFMLRLPPGFRFERYLIKQALIHAFPDLAKVPVTESGYPMVSCLRDSLMRLDQQIRWRLQMAGLSWVDVERLRPYADYDTWMRGTLRSWVEGTLLNKRSLERGYFNPDFVRSLVAEHMNGAAHAGKLGILLTLELWHRQFVD